MSSDNKVYYGKYFVAKKSESDSQFNDSSAFTLGWRPGQPEFSATIDSCTIDGGGASEGLKLSFCKNIKIQNSQIYGGSEDCVDIVRGENIYFYNCTFFANPGTKQHVTVKGGARNITFKNCKFIGSFKNWWNGACIDLGNWTDYDDVDRPKTRDIKIVDCEMQNVTFPLLCRRLYANSPIVQNTQGLGLMIPSWAVSIFWFLQRKGWLGKRRRFPESWLKIYDFEL